jgi:hypothetical protein
MLLNNLKALLTTAGKNDFRYYLNGIHFKTNADGRFQLTATDGCRVSRINYNNISYLVNQTGRCHEATLCRTSIETLIRGAARNATIHIEVVENEEGIKWVGKREGMAIDMIAFNDCFPDIQDVFPKSERLPKLDDGIIVNPEYLADVGTFAKLIMPHKMLKSVILKFGDATEVVDIQVNHSSDIERVQYVLFPCLPG